MPQTRSSVADQVVRKVASVTGTDEVDLPPLYDVIDPDALVRVVETMSSGEITFSYVDCDVTVDSDGSVRVADEFVRGSASGTAVGNS
ncbi:HalOD1 output domain-containing protein [Halobellus rufus]|uniref:HalOD1 output domain-containing protein n=1 Tax=Halobellus rufus TaxID=1448860 RepID=UPI000679CDF0|nr:HalOD1 output domain-containing protein [Halobellus rufus]